MTISSEASRMDYVGNAVTTVFPYTFKILDKTHIQVYQSTGGVESLLTVDVDYTVSGVGAQNGGNITMAVAPPLDDVLVFLRALPLLQDTDIKNQSTFYPEIHETVFDKLVMIQQQLAEGIARAVKISATSGAAPEDYLNLAATSAAAAAASEAATAADAIATSADAVATAADRVQTGLDAAATSADAVATAADRVQTGLDAAATSADAVATAADAATASAAAITAVLYGRARNDIINGQFRIAQAGTSFAAPASATYDLDGWFQRNTSAAVFTVARAAGRSTGKLARTVTVTTADASVAAGDFVAQGTRIEGYDCVKYLTGESVLGVWIKAPVTGIHCVSIYNGTSSYVQECDVLVAGTPQFFALQFPVTPVIASAINSYGLEVRICNMAGATYQTAAGAWAAGDFYATANQVNDFATIGNVFALEDVTLNLGTVPTVDDATYEEDFERCRRYCRLKKIVNGFASGTTVIIGYAELDPPMRAVPSVTALNNIQTFQNGYSTIAQSSAGGALHYARNDMVSFQFSNFAGLTANTDYYNISNDASLQLEARL